MPRTILIMGRVLEQQDGLAVYAENLLDAMVRLDPGSRYVVALREGRGRLGFARAPNVEVVTVEASRKILWDQVAVPRFARRIGADLIFNPKFSVPLFTRIPSVFVLHAADWFVNPGNYEWWDNLYIRLMLPTYARRAAGLTAISQTIVDELHRHTSIDPRKITVSHAAPGPLFRPVTEAVEIERLRADYGLPPRYILSVVRVTHTGHAGEIPYAGGNVRTLIPAWREYRRRGGTLPLVVAGHGVDRRLASLGLAPEAGEDIVLTGFVPHERMPALYSSAVQFVLPTLYESFSLPLVEAMACGCPVVAPSTGACPEVAGDAVRLVDPRDAAAMAEAMLDLEGDDDARETLRAAGLQRAAGYTWDRAARQTLTAFDRALQGAAESANAVDVPVSLGPKRP